MGSYNWPVDSLTCLNKYAHRISYHESLAMNNRFTNCKNILLDWTCCRCCCYRCCSSCFCSVRHLSWPDFFDEARDLKDDDAVSRISEKFNKKVLNKYSVVNCRKLNKTSYSVSIFILTSKQSNRPNSSTSHIFWLCPQREEGTPSWVKLSWQQQSPCLIWQERTE